MSFWPGFQYQAHFPSCSAGLRFIQKEASITIVLLSGATGKTSLLGQYYYITCAFSAGQSTTGGFSPQPDYST